METSDLSSTGFKHPQLTPDEWKVLEKLVQEIRATQIAMAMDINIGWVRHRFSFLRKKYGCENISAVKRLVQAKGMPPPPQSDA